MVKWKEIRQNMEIETQKEGNEKAKERNYIRKRKQKKGSKKSK